MKRAIVFDWDDTLINTSQICLPLYEDFARHKNIYVPTIEDLKKHWGEKVEDIVHFIWPEVENINEFSREFLEYVMPKYHPSLIEGAKEIIEKLSGNYVLGILTSSSKAAMGSNLNNLFGSSDLFDFVLTSDDTKIIKPDPKVFDNVLEELKKHGINEKNMEYIGDNHWADYGAAKSRGIGFYAVTTGFSTKEDFMNAGLEEKYILNNVGELSLYL